MLPTQTLIPGISIMCKFCCLNQSTPQHPLSTQCSLPPFTTSSNYLRQSTDSDTTTSSYQGFQQIWYWVYYIYHTAPTPCLALTQRSRPISRSGLYDLIIFAFTFIFFLILRATQTNFMWKMFVQQPIECIYKCCNDSVEITGRYACYRHKHGMCIIMPQQIRYMRV